MTSDRLNIPVGTALTLETQEGKTCYFVNLIGYLNGEVVLVTVPSGIDPAVLAQGERVIVRYIHDDSIVGFESELLYGASEPFAHWHLRYPKGVQGRILRRSVRVPYEAPGFGAHGADNGQQQVRVVDISLSGARVRVPHCAAHVGEGYVLELTTAPGRSVRLRCHIRHLLSRPDGSCELGVEFDEPTQQDYHQIEAMVRHVMAANRLAD